MGLGAVVPCVDLLTITQNKAVSCGCNCDTSVFLVLISLLNQTPGLLFITDASGRRSNRRLDFLFLRHARRFYFERLTYNTSYNTRVVQYLVTCKNPALLFFTHKNMNIYVLKLKALIMHNGPFQNNIRYVI